MAVIVASAIDTSITPATRASSVVVEIMAVYIRISELSRDSFWRPSVFLLSWQVSGSIIVYHMEGYVVCSEGCIFDLEIWMASVCHRKVRSCPAGRTTWARTAHSP